MSNHPEKIDDFRIVRELGRGGMGVVYEAIEEPLGRHVALKVLHPSVASGQGMEERFIEEARSIARLSHPSIVKVHRFGRSGTTLYLVLEYVEGAPLDELLAGSAFGTTRTIKVLTGIARALGHAHAAGIVHRDVKPGNVFIRTGDEVVLGDFGLAKDLDPASHKLTRAGTIMGTPAYMSPEQAQAQPVGPQTDVYALGVMAFEMLSGRVPFTADSAVSILLKHVNDPLPSLAEYAPTVPRTLVALINRMLEKDPSRRPANGDAVAKALDDLRSLEGQGDVDTQPTLVGVPGAVSAPASFFEELEITAAAFELTGFAKVTVQSVLPARAAFLLESWYRLAHQAIRDEGGTLDRHVADRVTCIFGYPEHHADHAQRALRASLALTRALDGFNRAHDLSLAVRCGIATGTVLVGKIQGDISQYCAQGPLMGQMQALAKTKTVSQPVRLNRAAYRRCYQMGDFTRFEQPGLDEAWATGL